MIASEMDLYGVSVADPTASYIASVHARGGAYIPSLPANTNLGPSALEKPGARIPDTSTATGWRYELAPWLVQASAATAKVIDKAHAGALAAVNAANDALPSGMAVSLSLVLLIIAALALFFLLR